MNDYHIEGRYYSASGYKDELAMRLGVRGGTARMVAMVSTQAQIYDQLASTVTAIENRKVSNSVIQASIEMLEQYRKDLINIEANPSFSPQDKKKERQKVFEGLAIIRKANAQDRSLEGPKDFFSINFRQAFIAIVLGFYQLAAKTKHAAGVEVLEKSVAVSKANLEKLPTLDANIDDQIEQAEDEILDTDVAMKEARRELVDLETQIGLLNKNQKIFSILMLRIKAAHDVVTHKGYPETEEGKKLLAKYEKKNSEISDIILKIDAEIHENFGLVIAAIDAKGILEAKEPELARVKQEIHLLQRKHDDAQDKLNDLISKRTNFHDATEKYRRAAMRLKVEKAEPNANWASVIDAQISQAESKMANAKNAMSRAQNDMSQLKKVVEDFHDNQKNSSKVLLVDRTEIRAKEKELELVQKKINELQHEYAISQQQFMNLTRKKTNFDVLDVGAHAEHVMKKANHEMLELEERVNLMKKHQKTFLNLRSKIEAVKDVVDNGGVPKTEEGKNLLVEYKKESNKDRSKFILELKNVIQRIESPVIEHDPETILLQEAERELSKAKEALNKAKKGDVAPAETAKPSFKYH